MKTIIIPEGADTVVPIYKADVQAGILAFNRLTNELEGIVSKIKIDRGIKYVLIYTYSIQHNPFVSESSFVSLEDLIKAYPEYTFKQL